MSLAEYFPRLAPPESFQWAQVGWAVQGDTLLLTLQNPSRRNALSPTLLNELAYGLAWAETQPDLRFVRLRAAGEVFCAGADLRAFAGEEESPSTVPKAAQPIVLHAFFPLLTRPLLAEVTGDVVAGGLLLITGATFVIAHKGVRFALPEVRRGLFPFQVLKALSAFMPPRLALAWCLVGEARTAAELLPWGLVTHLVETPEAVFTTADQLIAQLREGAPLAQQRGIAAYHHLAHLSHEDLHGELLKLVQTEDFQEGLRAFQEKRKPTWKGR
ncbi:MAG: enoyl-CoA hydratase [Bacteroidia bacterium]|nr:MAG: enoyl-CoA hydratase [Bacteroidia bacterium]